MEPRNEAVDSLSNEKGPLPPPPVRSSSRPRRQTVAPTVTSKPNNGAEPRNQAVDSLSQEKGPLLAPPLRFVLPQLPRAPFPASNLPRPPPCLSPTQENNQQILEFLSLIKSDHPLITDPKKEEEDTSDIKADLVPSLDTLLQPSEVQPENQSRSWHSGILQFIVLYVFLVALLYFSRDTSLTKNSTSLVPDDDITFNATIQGTFSSSINWAPIATDEL
jgi:hypothetical protein